MQVTEQDNRSITGVLQGIVHNVEVLVVSQVELAKAEGRETVRDGAKAVVPLGVGIMLGQLALGLLLLAAVSALATRYPVWLSALGVGVIAGIVALVMIAQGRKQMALVGQTPTNAGAPISRSDRWQCSV
ncbi:MAG: phage holin family protein [Thioalkalivibrio sp.]|nr:phage holin family protein [Thioalkalivibrio sp.]